MLIAYRPEHQAKAPDCRHEVDRVISGYQLFSLYVSPIRVTHSLVSVLNSPPDTGSLGVKKVFLP